VALSKSDFAAAVHFCGFNILGQINLSLLAGFEASNSLAQQTAPSPLALRRFDFFDAHACVPD
jgi:hypothetical protein